MNNQKKLLLFLLVLVLTMMINEMPYLNVFLTDKIWVIYLALAIVFYFLFFSLSKRMNFIFILLLLLASYFLTLFRFAGIADSIGIVIYFLLWIAIITKIRNISK